MQKCCKKSGKTIDEVKTVGIGSHCTVDNSRGMIIYANNLKIDHAPIAVHEEGRELGSPTKGRIQVV